MVPHMGACISTRPIPCIFFESTPTIGLVNIDCEELGHIGPAMVKTQWTYFIYIVFVCLDTLYSMVGLFEDYWVGI